MNNYPSEWSSSLKSFHSCFSRHDTQKHPDFPKKPLTPYFRFFMEKRAKYAKLHPEMSNLDLTKILSKKYRELPDKKKVSRKQMPRLIHLDNF